ncbi:MAG: hypothetical protein AAGA78_13575, partial [Pseudomonadota bacterium]
DIDLMAQALALHAGGPTSPHPGSLLVSGDHWISKEDRQALAQARAVLSNLDLATRLVGPDETGAHHLSPDAQALLRRVAGLEESADLDAEVHSARARAGEIIATALDVEPQAPPSS